jgi:hypothetical protein
VLASHQQPRAPRQVRRPPQGGLCPGGCRAGRSAADIALPYLALNLGNAPELRRLFEITQLSARLRDDSDHVTITIKLLADQLPEIAHAAERSTTPRPLHKKRLLRRQALLVWMLYVPPAGLEPAA